MNVRGIYKLFDLSRIYPWSEGVINADGVWATQGIKQCSYLCCTLIVLKVMKRELDPVLWCAKRRYTSFIPSWDISIWPHYTPHDHNSIQQENSPPAQWVVTVKYSEECLAQIRPHLSAHTSPRVCVTFIVAIQTHKTGMGGILVYTTSPQVTKQSKQSKSKVLKVLQNITTFMGQFTRKKAQ